MDYNYNRYLDPEFFTKKESQRKEIKQLGLYTGLALICQIVLQNIISLLLDFANLSEKYLTDGVFQNSFDVVTVVLSLLVPFYFIGKKMKEVSGTAEAIPLGKPVDGISFILSVVAGVGFCMMANIATSYFTLFFSFFGVELTSPEIAMPGGMSGVISSLIRVVIIAALTEEITLRGYVMGNLRKYGDMFAIVASSLVFALMHGNLVQAPFALIAGFALSYFSIKTGTVWTGIAIHASNNLISTAITYAMDYLPEETVSVIYMFVIYGFMLFGIISMWLLKSRTAHIKLTSDYLGTTTAQKMKAFIFNPAMIIALGYMIYITMRFIGFKF
jgi:membrane protease YdiL (CAAX protease family)